MQLEVNTLFQTLTDVLAKIDPVNLNATLTALGEGLRGNGDDLGATLAGLNYYLQQLNPKLPTLQQDFQKTAVVANVYGDAGPDLARVFDNVPAISNTIVDEQDNLNATLLAATGLANNGTATLEPAENDYIAAVQRLRAPLKVAGDYSPVIGCVLIGTSDAVDTFAPIIGGIRPGLFVVIQLPARRTRLHLSGKPADRERLRAGRTAVACRTFRPSSTAGRGTAHRSWSPTTPTFRSSRTPNCSSTRRRRCSSCSTAPTPSGMTTDEPARDPDQRRHLHGRHAAGRGDVWWSCSVSSGSRRRTAITPPSGTRRG